MSEEILDSEIFTLTDEDGVESQFEMLGTIDLDGSSYVAMTPIDSDEDEGEYIILKVVEEDGEEVLVTIDDDEEFDKVADAFEDMYVEEIDYDGDEEESDDE